jgi:hypothetical protein
MITPFFFIQGSLFFVYDSTKSSRFRSSRQASLFFHTCRVAIENQKKSMKETAAQSYIAFVAQSRWLVSNPNRWGEQPHIASLHALNMHLQEFTTLNQ